MSRLIRSSLLISILFLCACQEEKSVVAEILRPVRTIVIQHPNSGKVMQYAAVVDASQKADLSFKVSGELIHVYVKQGDEVKKHQILAKLNDTDIKLKLAEAQSTFDKAKADYDRGMTLIDKNVISKADIDTLKAQYTSANTKLKGAKNNLEYTNLYASFDGVIARKYSENFQEINAKQPIFALNNIDVIHLKINVPESVIIQIPRGDANRPIVAIFDDIPNQEFPAVFKEVSLQADEITKTYEVTFSMASPKNHTILPGMTAVMRGTQRMTSKDKMTRFYLPSHSVLKDSSGNYVYIVETVEVGKGKIVKKLVTIGEITSNGIEVFSGVYSGQYLVTAGVSKIADGMFVKFTANP
ncbi:MAG: efflux transporter periplasmic adaptor subunit [Gammaproteobacteria bacterium]|nr:MAG: efflux transporter periplasmic adaptor subunit [Gammaproteobacteria bacterium]